MPKMSKKELRVRAQAAHAGAAEIIRLRPGTTQAWAHDAAVLITNVLFELRARYELSWLRHLGEPQKSSKFIGILRADPPTTDPTILLGSDGALAVAQAVADVIIARYSRGYRGHYGGNHE